MKNIIWCFAMAVLMSNVDAAAPNPVGHAAAQPAQEVVLTKDNWQQFARLQNGVLTISAQVTKIGESCFYGNKQIRVVNFEPGSKLHTIEEHAFGDTLLEGIQLPDSLRTIGNYAFYISTPCTIEFGPNSQIKFVDTYTFVNPSTVIVYSDQVRHTIFSANWANTLNAGEYRKAIPPKMIQLKP